LRALAAAVVVASFIVSSIAWGPPLALVTKQPGSPMIPINLSIVGQDNETGGIPSSSAGSNAFIGGGSNGSAAGEPRLGESPSIPNPLAGIGDAVGSVLNPGVSTERETVPRSGLALIFAVITPVVIAASYYVLYVRGKESTPRLRRRRRLGARAAEQGPSNLSGDNVFVRLVRVLSVKVSDVLGIDPDVLTHREVMHHARKILGLDSRVRAAIMGYERLRFASMEPSEEEVRAAEEVLRIASRRSGV